jgi:hypothetical protein
MLWVNTENGEETEKRRWRVAADSGSFLFPKSFVAVKGAVLSINPNM